MKYTPNRGWSGLTPSHCVSARCEPFVTRLHDQQSYYLTMIIGTRFVDPPPTFLKKN